MKWVPKTCHIVYVKIYKVLKKYTHDRKKMTTNEMKKKSKPRRDGVGGNRITEKYTDLYRIC